MARKKANQKARAVASRETPGKTPEQREAEKRAAEFEAGLVKVGQMDTIVEDISKGIPLAEICRRDGMPGLRTVYDWMEANADFAARIARAREAGYDMIAAEALRIADTPQEGVRVKIGGPNGAEETREDMLGHRKLQVETRLKLLAKWDPKRYGDKVQTELSGPDGGPIQGQVQVVPGLDPFEAYRLLKAGGKLERQD